MTIITVASTDVGFETMHWAIPPQNISQNTPIPRGLRRYGNDIPVATLGTSDETSVLITMSFPTPYIYLPKSLTIEFISDDLTSDFGNQGSVEYRPAAAQGAGTRRSYALVSPGQSFRLAVNSVQTYRPEGTWRQFLSGPNGDTIVMILADVSTDASVAGDVAWTADFWEYDIEQTNKWPINTPIPQLPY